MKCRAVNQRALKKKMGQSSEEFMCLFSLAAQHPNFGGYNGLSGLVRLLAGSSYK